MDHCCYSLAFEVAGEASHLLVLTSLGTTLAIVSESTCLLEDHIELVEF